MTAELEVHKYVDEGVVRRERICGSCYCRALANAVAAEDFAWAKLNDELTTLQGSLEARDAEREQQAGRAEPATARQISELQGLAETHGCTDACSVDDLRRLTRGEAADLIEDLREQPVPRTCINCEENFTAETTSGSGSDSYCKRCAALAPAQRRKVRESRRAPWAPSIHSGTSGTVH